MQFEKVGVHSWGLTFPTNMLRFAGFEEGDEIEVIAERGQLIIKKAVETKVTIDFTPAEVDALATGVLSSPEGRSALAKIEKRRSIKTIPQ